MTVDLLRDLDRKNCWLLMVDGSEQSYVDLDDPGHLEFEYVQHMSHVIATWREPGTRLRALHLGGGLCTVPRWIAARYPRSHQTVVELSAEIVDLCRTLRLPHGVDLTLADATQRARDGGDRVGGSETELLVVDLYAGPDTVTSIYSLPSLTGLSRELAAGGLLVANVSDAAPFDLSRTVAVGLSMLWPIVAVIAEPSVLRGRRSGNLVLAATDHPLDMPGLARRCAAGLVRGRLLSGEALRTWVDDAMPAAAADALPPSGEIAGRRLR